MRRLSANLEANECHRTQLAGKTKTETYEDYSKDLFIKRPARMKLLVVVSKLLTGFDAPPCPIFTLIKRCKTTPCFRQSAEPTAWTQMTKDFGYIVDYMELFGNVTNAIDVYTSELDIENFDKEGVEYTSIKRSPSNGS